MERNFLIKLDKKFEELQSKIKKQEQFDRKQKEKINWQCSLKKNEYHIPEIKIPETIEYDEEDEDDLNEEFLDEFQNDINDESEKEDLENEKKDLKKDNLEKPSIYKIDEVD